MSDTLHLLSPAKLNLFLHVTGRRADGYHDLQTVFQLLDWGDDMQFTSNDSGQISLDMTGMAMPGMAMPGMAMPDLDIPAERNLVVRAARLLQRGRLGAHIRVRKRIPAGGGLGGGSSNAATTLLALNRLWSLGLDQPSLRQLGASLGADVPVFVGGHSAWAEGIGDILQAVDLPPAWFLVIKPDCEVATAQIFSSRELTRNTSPITIATFFDGGTRNDCQPLVRALYPEVDKALKWLDNFGDARLTGTGACVFAAFQEQRRAQAALARLPADWSGFIARGVNTSPVTAALASARA
jgi:4-diphosphocytidyl-2-C-methyl-D-erythritol kinase